MTELITRNRASSSPSSGGLEALSPSTLFVNHSLMNTSNARRARQSVEGVFYEHHLMVRDNSHLVNFIHRSAPLSSLTFNLISYGADVEVAVNQVARDQYIFVVPLSGRAQVQNQDHDAQLSAGQLIVLDPRWRFRFDMKPDHSHLAVGVPKQRLSCFFSKYARHLDFSCVDFERKPYLLKEVSPGLPDLLGYICSEIDRPSNSAHQWMVAAALEETFLTVLVSALLGVSSTEQYSSELKLTAPACLQKAEQFMDANLSEDIDARDIANAAGVPVRTFYEMCKKYQSASPVRWLKRRRLIEARQDLLDPRQRHISITEIAHRYHQYHAGRFSKAYFNEFGERPSDTRKS